MAEVRDWRHGRDWGRPYEDDPYWSYRGDDRDWGRRSRDLWNKRDMTRRGWSGRDFARPEWPHPEARGYAAEQEGDSREEWDWQRRDRAEPEGYWGQGYGGRHGRDPRMAGRRAIGGRAPGGPWPVDESWGAGTPGWRRGYQSGEDWGRGHYEPEPYPEGYQSDRNWWDRATDEVSSWFGDEAAERRRRHDEARHYEPGSGHFRGHGPRGYTRSDERIREDVSDRLTDNPVLDATEIEVLVAEGEVTLAGLVDSRYSKRLAEDLADEVSGVKHVQNNLRLRPIRSSSETGPVERSGLTGSGSSSHTHTITASMAGSGETTTGARADKSGERK